LLKYQNALLIIFEIPTKLFSDLYPANFRSLSNIVLSVREINIMLLDIFVSYIVPRYRMPSIWWYKSTQISFRVFVIYECQER